VFRDAFWFLRSSLTTGNADAGVFQYGNPDTDFPLMCDWNGDGVRTVGIRRGITFHLRNSNSAGVADTAINFGDPEDIPICGDWDGDGTETIGLFRWKNGIGEWFLFNRTNAGADPNGMHFFYGEWFDFPIVGDWDGDGDTTIGVNRGFEFLLRNSNTTGVADLGYFFGNEDDFPIVGDWDKDGDDTVGMVRGNGFFLRNAHSTGVANAAFSYGNDDDFPLIWFVP
jgi:hypothetical protein